MVAMAWSSIYPEVAQTPCLENAKETKMRPAINQGPCPCSVLCVFVGRGSVRTGVRERKEGAPEISMNFC